MKTWKRILAALMMLAMLAPLTAAGEEAAISQDLAVPETIPEEAAPADVPEADQPAVAADVASADAENAGQEVELSLIDGDIVAKEAEAPVARGIEVVIDPSAKVQTLNMSLGETLRVRVAGATVTGWKASKSNLVTLTMGEDGGGAYVDVTAVGEAKKLTLTAAITGHKKKKATLNLVILNPYVPKSLAFKDDMPGTLPVGATVSLPEMLVLTPANAVTTLSYKASGGAKVDRNGLLTTTKAGKATITVTTSNNKSVKATFKLQVMANKVKGMSPKPGRADYIAIDGGWTLWPVSVEATRNGLAVQMNLLNATGEKATKLQNLELTLAAGTRDHIIARYSAESVSASVGSGKAKTLKFTMKALDLTDVFLPEHYEKGTLFFDINRDAVSLNSKRDSYDFIPTLFPSVEPVSGIVLSPESGSLQLGQTLTLFATVLPDTAGNPGLTWSTSDPAVATVESGLVRAVGVGEAEITAQAVDGSGVKAACHVIVDPPVVYASSVTLDRTTADLRPGGTQTLTAAVKPDNTTNRELIWSSSDPAVAAVNDGVVSAVSLGEADITAEAADGRGAKAVCHVKVWVPVTSIRLSRSVADLPAKRTLALTAEVGPADATDKTLVWTTSDAAVATVADGEVTTVAPGEAVITATAADGSGVSATCTVTVNHLGDFVITSGVITGYVGAGGKVSIPERGEAGETIVAIGEKAFKGNTSVTGVTVPAGVTEIGPSAFEDCTALESVKMPHGVTAIRQAAFKNCTALNSMTCY